MYCQKIQQTCNINYIDENGRYIIKINWNTDHLILNKNKQDILKNNKLLIHVYRIILQVNWGYYHTTPV